MSTTALRIIALCSRYGSCIQLNVLYSYIRANYYPSNLAQTMSDMKSSHNEILCKWHIN